jgi:hypothetical protein
MAIVVSGMALHSASPDRLPDQHAGRPPCGGLFVVVARSQILIAFGEMGRGALRACTDWVEGEEPTPIGRSVRHHDTVTREPNRKRDRSRFNCRLHRQEGTKIEAAAH